MAKDIDLLGAIFYGVPAVDLPINGGGTARFMDTSDADATAADILAGKTAYVNGSKITGTGSGGGGDAWSWAGKNPTVVKTYTDKKFLKDTPFNTWTPTTTNTKLADAANVSSSYTGNIDNYDYKVVLKWRTHFEYGSGATGKNLITESYTFYTYDVYGNSNTYAAITTGTVTQTLTNETTPLVRATFYKDANGTNAFAAASFGVFPNALLAPTVSGSTITSKIPQINARCSTIYFTTSNAAAVDQNASYYEYKIEIIQVDRGTSNNGYSRAAVRDMWLNGIS